MAGFGGLAGPDARLLFASVTRCRQHRPRLRQSPRPHTPVLNPST
ncbi:hypothetical protein TcasGA2_TC034909 [Tribolium castaneum]|uniref:Uncharacterized protein n=1 Tax=Tribolium castaneum TaxID=7070 RepID=A0A139WAQ2_TRICA|nr:hypothetical protein TcasGA2_TC034909 [Tribolium castaneum]